MQKTNFFRTADIRLSKDSQGYYTATHKHQGTLYEDVYYDDRGEARRAAVEDLKYAKENGQTFYSEF